MSCIMFSAAMRARSASTRFTSRTLPASSASFRRWSNSLFWSSRRPSASCSSALRHSVSMLTLRKLSLAISAAERARVSRCTKKAKRHAITPPTSISVSVVRRMRELASSWDSPSGRLTSGTPRTSPTAQSKRGVSGCVLWQSTQPSPKTSAVA